jgi:hypothetical protein
VSKLVNLDETKFSRMLVSNSLRVELAHNPLAIFIKNSFNIFVIASISVSVVPSSSQTCY